MSCTCFGRTSQRKAQGDEMRTKLVEGLTAFATRRGFLQTAASACGAFGLALLGADVASGVSAYCCGLCLSPSTCTSCACTWSWTCVYGGDGCTYSCTECFQAGGCCCDGCSGVICSQVTQVSCPQPCTNPATCGNCCVGYICVCGARVDYRSCSPSGYYCDSDCQCCSGTCVGLGHPEDGGPTCG